MTPRRPPPRGADGARTRAAALRRLALAAAVWAVAGHAAAFTPVLNLVDPRGVQRGVETEVHFHGERLDGLEEVLLYDPGIEVRSLELKDPKHAVARVLAAPDARLGEHPLRLRTRGGITYQRTLWVGQFPTVPEQEPNNSFDQPQPITPGTTVQGVSAQEDVDFYLVPLRKGQVLSVEIEAMRLGRTMFDAYLAILGPDRFEIAVSDDTALLRNDGFASIVAPVDGDYRVLVREAAYEGNDNCQYRLHVGAFPRPAAVVPCGARPGETSELSFIEPRAGSGGTEPATVATLTRSVAVPPDARDLFPVFAERDGLCAPSPNWIRVTPAPATAESEPNDAAGKATVLPAPPCAAHGTLGSENDADWFRFPATKGQNLVIEVWARRLRSPADPLLALRDDKGKALANNDDQGGPDSIINWSCPADGDYLVVLRDHLRRGGPDFTYRLEVSPREPALSASLPVVERNNSQKWKMICVPRGNRYATVVNLARANIGCDALMAAESLPAGVTMEVPPVPNSISSFPVVFEAAADAPVAGGLHRFTVRSAGDQAPAVSGPLQETIHHVEINNQGAYHSTVRDLTPVAVIEEAPFRLELEPPGVPLVRNGTMNLALRAVRQPGFDAPITARLLWNPPGVGAPVTVTVPEKQAEAGYEINANGDAPTGEWRICILGEADTPAGPVVVSSALVPLEVAEPFLAMNIEMSATEQGRNTSVICKLDVTRPFEGQATAELQGLPHGVTSRSLEFDKDRAELSFPLEVAADAGVGKHANLFCRVVVTRNGKPVVHQVGQGGVLRIDKPSAPPPAAEDAPPQPAPASQGPAPAKPLSRLEQLRQEAAQ